MTRYALYSIPMSKRYDRITYSEHALKQLAERPLVTKADVELALNEGAIRKGEGEGLLPSTRCVASLRCE